MRVDHTHNQEIHMNKNIKGAVIASAMVSMFAAGTVFAADAAKDAGVKCQGANACKGTGSCKTAKNDCAGKNGCKGQGVTATKSEKECTDKGGTVAKK
jgi:hypothetical protein